MAKIYHKLGNAHDAYWFIHDHPKFMLPERSEVDSQEADKMEAMGYWVTRDRGGKCWRMHRHLHRHAIDLNLDIFYTKVNKRRIVDKDPKKNKWVECWLEFGSEDYMYMADWDTETHRSGYHDIDLDTGGPTFDQALVRLAKLVRKHHGDYPPFTGRRSEGKCGKPVCGDCVEVGATAKRLGLKKT
jgi:hypothetical protein